MRKKTKPMTTRPKHVFPRLAPVARFSAHRSSCMHSRASHRLHVFPRLAVIECSGFDQLLRYFRLICIRKGDDHFAFKFQTSLEKPLSLTNAVNLTSKTLLIDNSPSVVCVFFNCGIHTVQSRQRTQNWAPDPSGMHSVARRAYWANLWVDFAEFML